MEVFHKIEFIHIYFVSFGSRPFYSMNLMPVSLEPLERVLRCGTFVVLYIYFIIQGDSGGICSTLGNDSMSDSKQKSSYEHGSDFEWLRSYGHFLIPVHALM